MGRKESLERRVLVLCGILIVSLVVVVFSSIPRVVADSSIFEDGFETGDFSKWTTGGGSPSVTSGDAHCGSYKAVLDESDEYEQVWFAPVDHCFMRAYVMFKSFPPFEFDTPILGVFNRSEPHFYMAEARVGNFGGIMKWRLRYYNSGVSTIVTSEQQKPELNTWYCVEVEGKSNSETDAEARIYINGNELTDVSRTGVNNTRTINSAYIWESVTGGVTQWYDCVVVDTNYIGPECTLNVNVVGSGSVAKSPDESFYDWGTDVTLTATAAAGYSLDHWVLNGVDVGSVNPYTIHMTGNFDLTAIFTLIEYNYLVVRGTTNMIYYRIYDGSTGSWQDWNIAPHGSTLDSPAAAVYSGKLYIVVRGSHSNTIWFGSVNLTDYSFSGWALLSGSTRSAPTLVRYGSSLVLVVRGLTNWIYYRFYDCVSGVWGKWMQVPSGATIDSPAAALLGDELHIVVRSTDGYNIWHSSIDLSSSEFSGWQRVGGATGSRPVLAASESGSELYLVVRGTNDRIYYDIWDGVAWTGWVALPGGSTCDGPSAAVIYNKLNVVVRGSKGTTLWYGHVDLDNSGFSGWSRVDGSTNSAPTLTRS